MNWLQSIFYAFVTGFTKFLPISASAHSTVLQNLFGDPASPLFQMFVHGGALAGLWFAFRPQLTAWGYAYRAGKRSARRRSKHLPTQAMMDIALAKTAVVPLVIGYIFYLPASGWSDQLHICALFWLLNGITLYIAILFPRGNKDSRGMSPLDAVLIGIAAAASVFHGISLVGAVTAVAVMRGADRKYAYKWAMLLMIPAIVLTVIFNGYSLIAGGFAGVSFILVLKSLLCAAVSFAGAFGAVSLMRSLTERWDLSGFSFYSWGAALFAFILYLI